MSIKSTRQFKDGVDEAFEAMKTRDKAKACYDFARDIAGSSRGGHRAPPEVGIRQLARRGNRLHEAYAGNANISTASKQSAKQVKASLGARQIGRFRAHRKIVDSQRHHKRYGVAGRGYTFAPVCPPDIILPITAIRCKALLHHFAPFRAAIEYRLEGRRMADKSG